MVYKEVACTCIPGIVYCTTYGVDICLDQDECDSL
jgi:hypothetical protein